MYKIIGADGKAYGPVSSEQIRQWIKESRVNGQTQVQAEGAEEWRPLSSYAEFADAFSGPSMASAPSVAAFESSGGRDAALKAVNGPAIGLKVTAIIGLILVAIGLVMNILSLAGVQIARPPAEGDPQFMRMFNTMGGAFGILTNVIGIVIAIIILKGASRMQQLTHHQYAFTAAILAMVPCVSPCCFLGLPFGIWALVVLNKPEVKSQFS
jgi:hypothetical protein